MKKTFPPELSALMAQYRDTAAGLGDDHPITRRLWLLVVTTAPTWFRDEINAMAKELDLMPAVWGCDDNGHKFFALDELAANLGIDLAEAQRQMAQLQADAVAAKQQEVRSHG